MVRIDSIMNDINWDADLMDHKTQEEASGRQIPPMFICPLTNCVMVDPVVDPSVGVTYERNAILEQHPSLHLVPNLALKELIQNCMGQEWVQKRTDEVEKEFPNAQASHQQPVFRHCVNQERIISFLDQIEQNLTLDHNGECIFVHDRMLITVNVPHGKDLLILYVCPLTPTLTLETRNKMLRLNFMQAESFGGWLSLRRKEEEGTDEVMFSFAIAVSDFPDLDYFKNVLQNFSTWAFQLRHELWDETKVEEDEKMNYPSPNDVGKL